MPNLIGRSPNQLSTNGMLGTAAFIDAPQLPVSTATQTALESSIVAERASTTTLTNKTLGASTTFTSDALARIQATALCF